MLKKIKDPIAKFLTTWLTKEAAYDGLPKCDYDRICYEIRPCDVLLIEGRSKVSNIIKHITKSSWSHAALYIGRLYDIQDIGMRKRVERFCQVNPFDQLVFEGIMGKGAVISPLSNYKYDHVRICRPHGLSPHDAQRVINYVISRLGSGYDVRQIIDLFMFLLPWHFIPRRFLFRALQDNSFTHTICSTVIAEAFSYVEFPVLPLIHNDMEKGIELIQRNPRLFTPSDFDYSPYFSIIKYPFISFNQESSYRKLPWNRDGLLSNDEYRYHQFPKSSEEKKSPRKDNEEADIPGFQSDDLPPYTD